MGKIPFPNFEERHLLFPVNKDTASHSILQWRKNKNTEEMPLKFGELQNPIGEILKNKNVLKKQNERDKNFPETMKASEKAKTDIFYLPNTVCSEPHSA